MLKMFKKLEKIRMLEKIANEGLGHHSINTLIYYMKMYDKYQSLRSSNHDHWDACDDIGVSEKHFYKIKKAVEKINKSI